MNRTYTYATATVIGIILIGLLAFAYRHAHAPAKNAEEITTVSYLCRDGKTMDAQFSGESVTLTLSDTRAFVLPQVPSGSGIRYEKEGVAFVGKGDNAFLEEGGKETFEDCVVNGNTPTGLGTEGMRKFTDSAGTFSFMYPSTVSVSGGGVGYSTEWMGNSTSTGLVLSKITLSKSFAPNTNFSDATLTIGTSADPSAVSSCLTYNPSGGPAATGDRVTLNGTTFTKLTSSDAGAGNRYNTTSYRTVRGNQCYVVEYTIHSTAIENYSPDQNSKEFEVKAVQAVMDSIVQSFQFTDGG